MEASFGLVIMSDFLGVFKSFYNWNAAGANASDNKFWSNGNLARVGISEFWNLISVGVLYYLTS